MLLSPSQSSTAMITFWRIFWRYPKIHVLFSSVKSLHSVSLDTSCIFFFGASFSQWYPHNLIIFIIIFNSLRKWLASWLNYKFTEPAVSMDEEAARPICGEMHCCCLRLIQMILMFSWAILFNWRCRERNPHQLEGSDFAKPTLWAMHVDGMFCSLRLFLCHS
jgi:hypothetical protein